MNKQLRMIFNILLITAFFTICTSPLLAWSGDSQGVATFKSLEDIFRNILKVVLSIMGLATFVIIVVGGFKYLTSGGDAKSTEQAQSTITYGIMGLVLAIGAWIILTLIEKFTGIEILKFSINI